MPKMRIPAPKLTVRQWEAIASALDASLAGNPIDGFDEGSREEELEIKARESAAKRIEEYLRAKYSVSQTNEQVA